LLSGNSALPYGLRSETDENSFDDRDSSSEKLLGFQNPAGKWLYMKKETVKPSSCRNPHCSIMKARNTWGNANIKHINKNSSVPFSSKLRLIAFKKQKGRCYYCESPMWHKDIKNFAEKYGISKSAATRFQCTAEHLKARCDGGINEKKNIVAACLFCNNNRHHRKKPPAPSDYRADIRRRLNKGKWHPRDLHLA
jgi:hypothetical protein